PAPCDPSVPASTRGLSGLSGEFVEVVCRPDPVAATFMGIHDYGDRFPDDSREGFEERLTWLRDLSARLDAQVDAGSLPRAHQVDHMLLRSRVDAMRFHLESLP